MNKEEVIRLAGLARIEVGDAEAEKLSHEFDAILAYVGEIKKVAGDLNEAPHLNKGRGWGEVNVFRADENSHETGLYTEAILKNAPAREGDYIKVKNIL